MERQQAEPEPATLLALPPEIQTKIFSYLIVPFGKSSIQAVLRTCKELYKTALPVSVSVFRNTAQYRKHQGPCSKARNIQFLRYILVTQPWLADHVRTIIVGSFSWENENEDGCSEITNEELAVYRKHIKFILGQFSPSNDPNHFDDFYRLWVEDLRKGNSDAQVALLILACPNIRTLLFETYEKPWCFALLLKFICRWSNGKTEYPEKGIPEKSMPLSKLEDVFHETSNRESFGNFSSTATYLFGLPRLRYYECLAALGMDSSYFKTLLPRSSSVEDITLHHAFCTADLLSSMLGACRALKKFEYSFLEAISFGRFDSAMPRDILDAILPHANTLEYLYLNLQEDRDHQWNWHDHPERLYMGTGLQQMHALKSLTVGMQALTGMLASQPDPRNSFPLRVKVEGAARIIDCLPENLESLKIHSCGPAILDQLQELFQVITKGRRFKKLTYIGVLYHAWRVDTKEIIDYMNDHPALDNDMVTVDIGFQSMQAYHHDLVSNFEDSPNRPSELMSRIYAPNFRSYYLDRRMNTRYADGVYDYESVPGPFEA